MAKALKGFAAAAALGLAAACASPSARAGEPALRVASFNIQAGGGNLERTIAAIRAMKPDIVGLQEVDVHWSDRSQFADQATALGAALGMHVRFAPIYRIPSADASRPPREFGVALLSRFPIVQFRNDSLTRHSTQEPNAAPAPMPGLLNAMVLVDGVPVRVMSTHLDYRADPAVRAKQVSEMLLRLSSSEPTILLGDLNAPPDAQELAPLFAPLRDAWTVAAGDGLTYPAEKPVKRIDYVLVSSHFEARSAAVIPGTASDHRPVIAELVLRKSR